MRVLAFSDIHEEDAALEKLRLLSPNFDYAFICGDISQSNIFTEAVLEAFPNGFVIPGNWDTEQVNDLLFSSSHSIHEKRVELVDGLNAVGFGYSNPTPFGTYGELSEEELYKRMSKLKIDRNTLLMLHCPPKGYFDDVRGGLHVGSDSILRIITEKKPLAAFFGHVHEHVGVKMLGVTTLIKLPPANEMKACSLEITNKKINVEFITL